MTLKHYRPSGDGTLQPTPDVPDDYRTRLQSRRWNAAPLENPEVHKTNAWIAVAYLAAISAVTFVVLVVGYGTGFWG
jgi:hypothetical protein